MHLIKGETADFFGFKSQIIRLNPKKSLRIRKSLEVSKNPNKSLRIRNNPKKSKEKSLSHSNYISFYHAEREQDEY